MLCCADGWTDHILFNVAEIPLNSAALLFCVFENVFFFFLCRLCVSAHTHRSISSGQSHFFLSFLSLFALFSDKQLASNRLGWSSRERTDGRRIEGPNQFFYTVCITLFQIRKSKASLLLLACSCSWSISLSLGNKYDPSCHRDIFCVCFFFFFFPLDDPLNKEEEEK